MNDKNFHNARKTCINQTPRMAVPHWAGDDDSLFRAIEALGDDYNNMKVWTSGIQIGTKYMWGVNCKYYKCSLCGNVIK